MNLNYFKDLRIIYKSVPFFSLNDKLDEDELKRQIDEFADKGYGGTFLHTRVGLVTGYLSSDWMRLMSIAVSEFKRTKTYSKSKTFSIKKIFL